MNCQDLSRILDSCDVNALSADERRACETHAASCPHCGPEWVVYSRLAAIPAPGMPQGLAARCAALAAARLGGVSGRRPPSWTVLLSTILAVAAAAAVLVARLTSPPPKSVPHIAISEPIAPPAAPAAASPASRAPNRGLAPHGTPVQPVTVLLVLNQETDDAKGRDLGQQVYAQAREELRKLPGLVLVDAGETGTATPALRMTYTTGMTSGIFSGPTLGFKVEAFQPGDDGAGTFHTVFDDGGQALMCIKPPTEPCHITPSDIAAYDVLSWHLKTTAPDPALEERLHAILVDSSAPILLRIMSFISLDHYKKLRMDAGEVRAAGELLIAAPLGAHPFVDLDPALQTKLLSALGHANGRDVMTVVQDLLTREAPNGDRVAGIQARTKLVDLLATDLRNEPAALVTLESVAVDDPGFDVRAEARRVLEAERRTR